MANNFVQDFFQSLDTVIQNQIGSNVANVTSVIAPVFAAAVGLYVVFISWQILYTNREIVVLEVAKNIAALAVVSVFTAGGAYYADYVIPFGLHAGDELSAAITGSAASGTALDGMFNNAQTSIAKILDDMEFDLFSNLLPTLRLLLAVFLILLGSSVYIFMATAYLLVAKFMMGIVLSLGTIFISFAMFPTTRGMFTSWCGQLVHYTLLSCGFTIVQGILNSYITSKFNLGDLGIASAFQIVIIFFVGGFAMVKLDQVIAAMSGGTAIHGLMGQVAGGVAKATRGAASGMGTAARKVGSSMFGRKDSIKGG